MEQFNLDQLKQDACRTLALIDLIERSKAKAKTIYGCHFFSIFGTNPERTLALEKQNSVTMRLVNYLEIITLKK